MPKMSVQEITNFDMYKKQVTERDDDVLIFVDYFETWCAPCMAIAPKIDDLAEEYSNIEFYKVDLGKNEDVGKFETITSLPTFKYYTGGDVVDTVVGANIVQIKKKIALHMTKPVAN